MVRQELTGGRVTGRPCKPHPEQDLIGGYSVPGLTPGWSHDPDSNIGARWMAAAPALPEAQNSAYRPAWHEYFLGMFERAIMLAI
jgi:hypothetical protein